MLRQCVVIAAFVLLLRLPFLNQALQLDDFYYLAAAQYAQADPLHPHHARYVFQGEWVDMRGHPHPPLNAWFLGLLVFLGGGVRPVAFHGAYVLFSLISGWSILALARRFSPHPVLATMLALLAPAFVIDGNSLMSDLPLLAWWTLGVASLLAAVTRRSSGLLVVSAGALLLAGFTAYQAVFLTPLLLAWLWRQPQRYRPAILVSLVPVLSIGGYQLFERLTGGPLPATELVANFQTYNLQSWTLKSANVLALTAHLGWLLFPILSLAVFTRLPRRLLWGIAIATVAAMAADLHPLFWLSFGVGLVILAWCAKESLNKLRDERWWLAAWVVGFLAFAFVVFFAGAARYLLPVAPPLAILATSVLPERRWLTAAVGVQFALMLALAWVNYQHWDGYRRMAAGFRAAAGQHPIRVNGEWGMRHYFQELGAKPVLRNQVLTPDSWLVSSELSSPVPVSEAGVQMEVKERREIKPKLPLRLMGLGTQSAYTTVAFGLRPFDVNRRPADVVWVRWAGLRLPPRSWLPMNVADAEQHLGSGVYGLEGGGWRWMGPQATFVLKSPAAAQPVRLEFAIPEASPARKVRLLADGVEIARETYSQPGSYVLTSAPLAPAGKSVAIQVEVDRTYRPAGDSRDLGLVVSAIGFQEMQQ